MELSELPSDVLLHVLASLPVDALLRFKTICKAWYTLINTSFFTRCHLNKSLDPGSCNNRALSFIYKDRLCIVDAIYHPFTVTEFCVLDDDFRGRYESLHIVGSCNGLICLSAFGFYLNMKVSYLLQFLVCNPSTRTFKQTRSFMEEDFNPRLNNSLMYAFGYDSKHDDYKIAATVGIYEDVYIYSFKTDSWSCATSTATTSSIHIRPACHSSVIYGNNLLHYLVSGRDYRIARFDLSSEKWVAELRSTSGEAMDGCLYTRVWEYSECSDDWSIEDKDVEDSWIEMVQLKTKLSDYALVAPSSKDGSEPPHLLIECLKPTDLPFKLIDLASENIHIYWQNKNKIQKRKDLAINNIHLYIKSLVPVPGSESPVLRMPNCTNELILRVVIEPCEIQSDVLLHVLASLPVDALLRFKTVCKAWYTLINTSLLTHFHLNKSLDSNSCNNRALFFIHEDRLCTVDTIYHPFTVSEFYVLNDEFIRGYGIFESLHIVGSCNGLICLSAFGHSVDIKVSRFLVCNPSTRTFKQVLPFIEEDSNPRLTKSLIYGFGYDSKHDDYKIAATVGIYEDVYIYSFNADSWSCATPTSSNHSLPACACHSSVIYGNNLLHYRVSGDKYRIARFDLSSEKWRAELKSTRGESMDGCLYTRVWEYCDYYDDWSVEDYNVIHSWSKMVQLKTKLSGHALVKDGSEPPHLLIECLKLKNLPYKLTEDLASNNIHLYIKSLVSVPGRESPVLEMRKRVHYDYVNENEQDYFDENIYCY